MTDNLPANLMLAEDWQRLASAYDTWNSHVSVCEDLCTPLDRDLKDYVRNEFESYGLWNNERDEPNLDQYRIMFRNMR